MTSCSLTRRMSMPGRSSRSATVADVSRSLARWRSQHGRGFRIPEDLWWEAARLAATEGVNPISKALRLNYYDLKDRVGALDGAAAQVSLPPTEEEAQASFVEIPMAGRKDDPMEIEVESPSGWKLRVRAQEPGRLETLDVAGMVGALGGLGE